MPLCRHISAAALLFAAYLCSHSCSAFAPYHTSRRAPPRCERASVLKLFESDNNGKQEIPTIANDDGSRRMFFSRVATIASGAAASATFLPRVDPALAFGGGLNKVNAQLQSYGLPIIKDLPGGYSPLLEIWGKAANRSPLLVEFVHPSDWIVTLPSIDVNGEEGTIQAGQYAKGDTATLYILSDKGKVENVASQPKAFFQDAILKALTQKGSNLVQNFKVTKVEPTKGEYNSQDYVLVDFKYELLTGAGFTVDRIGTASVTSEGNAVQVLWSASTAQRYKKTEPQLRTITRSFRCYAEGLQLSTSLREVEDF